MNFLKGMEFWLTPRYHAGGPHWSKTAIGYRFSSFPASTLGQKKLAFQLFPTLSPEVFLVKLPLELICNNYFLN
nr:hypothetical protein [Flavobacterium fluviatile]